MSDGDGPVRQASYSTMLKPDPRPPGRVKDPELLKQLHLAWDHCVVCGSVDSLTLHHIHKHPRDDLEQNLVMLCGSGTTGCHGAVEHHSHRVCAQLAAYLIRERLDTMEYLGGKLGGVNAVRDWLRGQLHAAL